jgi:DNA-binding LacI/PurR family transcriptional regulator
VGEDTRKELARATIIDVADRAKVSKSLVSLVMRGASNVSEERRTAVLRAAAELGYRPNRLAQGLVRGRTHTIGVLLSDPHNPFFPETVDGIQDEADLFEYRALLATGYRDPQREARAVRDLLERQMDGIILLSPQFSTRVIREVALSTPTVLVGRRTREPFVDSIVNDDYAGATLAVEHLAELGHRRIAHITGGSYAGAGLRRRGYERTMRRLGLEQHVQIVAGEFTDEGGYLGAQRLLSGRERPTAIFVANDLATMGVLTAVHEAGLSVPDDISLVGYDNSYLAQLSNVSLTSIDQPRHEMGIIATRLLLERIESGRTEPQRELLKPRLILRSTSAPPPR